MLSVDSAISSAFSVATFGPQILWLLITFAPNWKPTKDIMGSWIPIIFFSLVHLSIVSLSISQPDGTAPLTEFAEVWKPSGNPLDAMMGMMRYRNFVSEEWSHVLTWDLVVGRFIWLDGIQRGIFTSHSVLLTNLIGPPGLLLHALTCFLLQKGLPEAFPINLSTVSTLERETESVTDDNSITSKRSVPLIGAEYVIREYFPGIMSVSGCERLVAEMCDEAVEWDDTNEKEVSKGRTAVLQMLLKRAVAFPSSARRSLDVVSDSGFALGSGYSWVLQDEQGRRGLRGITFVELNSNGKIVYVREVCEPLFKPGSATAELLKGVVKKAVEKDPSLGLRPLAPLARKPRSAEDMVIYLWREVNGSDKQLILDVFADDIEYTDFNYPKPFLGINAVSNFITEFDTPGIHFTAERISGGRTACCFTWRIELAGVEGSVKGISLYRTDSSGGRVIGVCDIAEPVIKPAPLQQLAAILNPALRRFQPLSD